MTTTLKLYLLSLNYSVNIGMILGATYSVNEILNNNKYMNTHDKNMHNLKYISIGAAAGAVYPLSLSYFLYKLNCVKD
jgi:hypothetical protein